MLIAWLEDRATLATDSSAMPGGTGEGRGYLTGKIDENTTFASVDIRSCSPRYTPEARKANRVVIDLLARIGEQQGATLAQITLAWLLAQQPWIVAIPGSRKLEHLDDNIGALVVELKPDDLREIRSAISPMTIRGDRYPENLKQMTGRRARRCVKGIREMEIKRSGSAAEGKRLLESMR